MERNKKNIEDKRNKNTSPTDLKGKDIDATNQTNFDEEGSPSKEGSNLLPEDIEKDEKSKLDPMGTEVMQEDKEHQTQQDKDRYNGSKNPKGMDTDLNDKNKKTKDSTK